MEGRWLSVDESSVRLGVSREKVYRWIEQSELPTYKVGRLWKFRVSEVDAWVKLGGSTHRGGKSNMVRQ